MTNKFHIGQTVYICSMSRKTDPNDGNYYGLVNEATIRTIRLKCHETKYSWYDYMYYLSAPIAEDSRHELDIFATEAEALAKLKSVLFDE